MNKDKEHQKIADALVKFKQCGGIIKQLPKQVHLRGTNKTHFYHEFGFKKSSQRMSTSGLTTRPKSIKNTKKRESWEAYNRQLKKKAELDKINDK